MKIEWRAVAEKDADRLDRTVKKRVITAIEQFAEEGRGNIRRLEAIQPPLYRLRIGDIRVLFRTPDNDTLLIERVLPRDKAYK